jgi:putative membrane protein
MSTYLKSACSCIAWQVAFFSVLIWSVIDPKDMFTWALEVAPAIMAGFALLVTRKNFPLTPLTYVLILIHAIILMVGGHYTYAEVPLFNDLGQWIGSDRNNYDKLGHFAQGFVPAIVAREIVIRHAVMSTRRWMNFFIICFCLGFSAFYELIEWWVALGTDDNAEAFLGTQGYVRDTQSDMAHALVGAIIALMLLAKIHDKQLSALNRKG